MNGVTGRQGRGQIAFPQVKRPFDLAGGRPGRPPKPPPPAGHEVRFPSVPNAIDYLRSVSKNLRRAPPSPRKLEYVVLNLHADTEVLLKALLARVHWTQVFRDLGTASHRRYGSGGFESCTLTHTLERLKKIADVTVGARAAKSLSILAAWTTHFCTTACTRSRPGRSKPAWARFSISSSTSSWPSFCPPFPSARWTSQTAGCG
ncbi:hypothetical protein OEIGOIKO_07654 [Streptomyces chrestomyceticus JCM 4735]|uniref:Uncharacterized protein n=1 Tax=Streptomyces chrestomyceticus JCM 4735 TaxID=1306181 RepID=A0A7U9L400_9ACTN|nr:hypothetical protein [Streptomyces chrestomyceticus]GCD39798.1 hypothetical protein OEIGOIKO_07654 [Streptomyces chrestomyceticus JCM 4735]